MGVFFLTGMMGSGKSTVGKLVGQKLKIPVLDTDALIEQRYEQSISEIFQEHGEAVFREYEHDTLTTITAETAVVTTGGGAVISAENRAFMHRTGTIIYLHCELDELVKRLEMDDSRPLLMAEKRTTLTRLYNERESFYKDAHYIVDSTHKTAVDTAREIVELIKGSQTGDNGNKNERM